MRNHKDEQRLIAVMMQHYAQTCARIIDRLGPLLEGNPSFAEVVTDDDGVRIEWEGVQDLVGLSIDWSGENLFLYTGYGSTVERVDCQVTSAMLSHLIALGATRG